jgi:hypothetical protein
MPAARRWHLWTLLLFVALSVADLGLTWLLIQGSSGAVYESNPVAGWSLQQGGWLGLAAFKVVQVIVVVGLGLFIARWRPRLGGWVLSGGCAVMACVVVYSLALSQGFGAEPGEPTLADLRALDRTRDQLQQELLRGHQYRAVLLNLSVKLADGSVTLADATAQLSAVKSARDADWLRLLRDKFPDCSDQECLAANLVTHTLAGLRTEPERAAARKEQLAEEFRALFARELPAGRLGGTPTPTATSPASDPEEARPDAE